MNLIPITTNENQEPIVSGRILHEFLGVNTAYTQWFERMTEYGFTENSDFALVSQKCETNNPKNPWTERHDHILKLDMAKELCMLARSDKGKEARRYFIEVEKEYNSPEKIMARALLFADKKIKSLEATVTSQAPYAKYGKAVESVDGHILIRDLAKIIAQNGIEIGERRLFEWMRKNNYMTLNNMPTQRSIERGLMVITECLIQRSTGSEVRHTTKITGKGQIYFVDKFVKELALCLS